MVGIIYHMYVNVKYKNPPTTPTIKLSNQKDIKAIPEELFGKYITGTTFLSLIWILLAFNAIIFSTISCLPKYFYNFPYFTGFLAYSLVK